jgi:hypothetical protein
MRIRHTAINSFLGRSVRNEISRLVCAPKCGFAKQKTADCNCEMRAFAPKSGGRDGSGLPVNGIARKQVDRIVLMSVSPVPFRLLLGHCFGAIATPGGTAPFCFPDSSPRASLGPCSRKHGLAHGSRAHLHGFAQV